MSDRDTVRRALTDAIGWQESLAEAYSHIPGSTEREEALRQAKEYRKLLTKRYQIGTPDDKLASETKPVRAWPR